MPILTSIEIHPIPTNESSYTYQFTPKHHGAVAGAAQWLPDMTLDEEFAIFASADENALADERGWLYGIWSVEGELRDLGTWTQQLAEFPVKRDGEAWHGYPIWAVNELAPDNRRSEKMRPDKEVFVRMEHAGLLTQRQRKRLFKGDHA